MQFYQRMAEVDRTRHNLPHWNQTETWTFVTWRLADALPKEKLEQWKREKAVWLGNHPEPWDAETEKEYYTRFTQRIDEWLDQGSGSCLLCRPENAKIVADALLHFNGARYQIHSFVVMPNHVHVLFAPSEGFVIQRVLQGWKGFSARGINKLEGRTGRLWQDEYWDRLVRNGKHFQRIAQYVQENPTKAKLKEGEYLLWEGGHSCPPQ